MGVFGTIVLVVVIYFLGKFIYDSYLTDNTEKQWNEFKKSDPMTADKIEGSTIRNKEAIEDYKTENIGMNSNEELNQLKIELVKKRMYTDIEDGMEKKINEYIYEENRILYSHEMIDKELDTHTNMTLISEIISKVTKEFKDVLLLDSHRIGLNEVEIIAIISDVTNTMIEKYSEIDFT